MNRSDKRQRFFLSTAPLAATIGVALFIKRLRKNSLTMARGQKGLTLLETVLAVGIIALIGIGVVRAVDTNARAGRVLDEQVQATNLITAFMEGMRHMTYEDSPQAYTSVGDSIVKPPQYTVDVDVAYSGDGTTWSSTNSSGALKLQRITISVFRTNGDLVLSTCTFRAKRPIQ